MTSFSPTSKSRIAGCLLCGIALVCPLAGCSSSPQESSAPATTQVAVETEPEHIAFSWGYVIPFDAITVENNSDVALICDAKSGVRIAEVFAVKPGPSGELKQDVYYIGKTADNASDNGLIMNVFYVNEAGENVHWNAHDPATTALELLGDNDIELLLESIYLGSNGEDSYICASDLTVTSTIAIASNGAANSSDASGQNAAGNSSAQDGSATGSAKYDSEATAASTKAPFWGVWVYASQNEAEATAQATQVIDQGFSEAHAVLTTDWENLNEEPWWCVTLGAFSSEQEAQSALQSAQAAGHANAYVKYSGEATAA